jgi:hypothetical protein
MEPTLQYVNNRWKTVSLRITTHARKRFEQRWYNLFPNVCLTSIDTEIAKWFSRANRVIALSNKTKKRAEKHGKDTLYFKSGEFTFVVQDAAIITIEISANNLRHLNKKQPVIPKAIEPTPELKEKPLPFFKLNVCIKTPSDEIQLVNLGSYESIKFQGDANLLQRDSEFIETILYRIKNRCGPDVKVYHVYARLGRNGPPVKVYERAVSGFGF